jgi:membrane fusion protein, heavy metal efflux system
LSHVVLPVAGRIAQVFVKIGDSVQQGQVLLTVESPDVDAALSGLLQAQASVTQAQAGLTKAEADYDRSKDLFEHNAIAKKEVLNQEAALAQAKAALEQAQASEQQARRRLEILGVKPGQIGQHVAVRAPISGKVLEMTVVPGEFRNDLSQPVMTIADLSTVWITSDVPETSIRLIDPGERVDIELGAYPGQVFRGRVTRIADMVDPQTRTVKVHAEIDNRDGKLRPEMFGQIHHVDSTHMVPVVPASAVIQGENQDSVFVELGPGRFRSTPVKVGSRVGDRIVVFHGLAAGSRVVTDGAMLLKGI